jgi:hypothetical protein
MVATAVRERTSAWDDADRGAQNPGTGYPLHILLRRSSYWGECLRTQPLNPSDFFRRTRQTEHLESATSRSRRIASRILPLLASVNAEITPSDNSTYYIEWETEVGFASLEIGTDRFGFSFLPHSGSAYGENGAVSDGAHLRRLIEAHI